MNENFYKEVCEKRAQEIQEGKNRATDLPIYIVYDAKWYIVQGWSNITPALSHKYPNWEYGYYDESLEPESREFCSYDSGMEDPVECSKFYADDFITCCFTLEAAEAFIEAEKHNYSEMYVYVEYAGRRNTQFQNLFGPSQQA